MEEEKFNEFMRTLKKELAEDTKKFAAGIDKVFDERIADRLDSIEGKLDQMIGVLMTREEERRIRKLEMAIK